jgi:hypothetical protein
MQSARQHEPHFLRLGYKRNSANQEQPSDDPLRIQWMRPHSEPAEVVNEQGGDERSRDRERDARPLHRFTKYAPEPEDCERQQPFDLLDFLSVG